MIKPSVLAFISGLLMLLSATALILVRDLRASEYFAFFMWIHVLIIALAFYGFWRLRKIGRVSPGGISTFLRGFPLWLALVGIPVAVVVAPLASESTMNLGQTADGQSVSRKSWNEKNGRYFLMLNNAAPVEISLTEYQALQRGAYEVFARAWVAFSYVCLILWQYVGRREPAVRANPSINPDAAR